MIHFGHLHVGLASRNVNQNEMSLGYNDVKGNKETSYW